MEKKGFEFSFTWLFAIVVGVMILGLAIYGVSKISSNWQYTSDTEIGKKIAILTNPLQSGFAEASYGKIEFNKETKIFNDCYKQGFGKNEISVSTKSEINEEWQQQGGATSVHNKYIFGQGQAKEFYVFSKPFYFPFKVADLTFLISEEYCLVDAPVEIENEVSNLNMENIKIGDCAGEITVCFGSRGCDINIYGTCSENCETEFDEGYVEKSGEKLSYVGGLMWGAVFSDDNTYECNVKRLMYRSGKACEVFLEKAQLAEARGCDTNLETDLSFFKELVSKSGASNLVSVNQVAKEIDDKNSGEVCGLW